jgi:hypothetical protein
MLLVTRRVRFLQRSNTGSTGTSHCASRDFIDYGDMKDQKAGLNKARVSGICGGAQTTRRHRPPSGQLKIEDFIDRSLISELESEGFISKIYEGR